MTRKLLAYLSAVAAAYTLGVVLISQFNIQRIENLGFAVSSGQRIETTVADLSGMLALYLPLMAIAFLIAFLFTGLALLRFVDRPAVLYPLAGFVALIAMHLILKSVFGMSPVAPARELGGLLTQGMVGAVGGWVYLRFAKSNVE